MNETLQSNQIRLDLSTVSSILNHADYKSLLCYLSIETYKKVVKDEYIGFDMFSPYNFLNKKEDWEKSMDKLVSMNLAVRNGDFFITRRKLKDWRVFCNENTPSSLKLNGYIIFDMTLLYRYRGKRDLRDLLYLSLINSVGKGKSISRGFIKTLTGINKHTQRVIEREYEGVFIETHQYHLPIQENESMEGIPTFSGTFNPSTMSFKKDKKGNCKIAQLGNKIKIKNLIITKFQNKKLKSKIESALDPVNKSSDGEVHDWEDLRMVLDTSTDGKSLELRGILNTNDPRAKSWKDFKNYQYHKVSVLSPKGELTNLRSLLSK